VAPVAPVAPAGSQTRGGDRRTLATRRTLGPSGTLSTGSTCCAIRAIGSSEALDTLRALSPWVTLRAFVTLASGGACFTAFYDKTPRAVASGRRARGAPERVHAEVDRATIMHRIVWVVIGTIPDPDPITPHSLPKPQGPCNTVLNFLSFHEWVARDLMNDRDTPRSL
jgi:hypothetical protein